MDAATLEAIENKLSAARTRLILDKPFLGALVLRLPLQAARPEWCPTTGTDARKFYYNPEYIQELRPDEAQFVLAHEALHCALSHFARRGHRIKHRWDIACDYAINPILVDEGLTPPPGSLIMNEYRDMTAEEIYPLIDEDDQTETIDQHLFDQDNQSGGGQQGDGFVGVHGGQGRVGRDVGRREVAVPPLHADARRLANGQDAGLDLERAHALGVDVDLVL